MGAQVGKGSSEGKMPKEMRRVIKEGWEEMGDLRQSLIGQFMGMLTGEGPMEYVGKEWVPSGEPGMQAPIIAQAEAAQRRATSRAMRETETGLARQGLAGTPFGENIMAQQRQQGAQALGAVAPNIIGQFLQMIPGYTQAQSGSLLGALPGTRETNAKQWQAGGETKA